MAQANSSEFSLKVAINKDKSKVLFAEVGCDFADALVSFLTLPLGKIVRILEKHYGSKLAPVVGSFSTLYTGLLDLDNKYFYPECGKKMLVNPKGSSDDCGKSFIERSALSFIVTDDLRLVPCVSDFIEMLSDIDGVELRSLTLGINDVIELLKFSLDSAPPLTDLILKERWMVVKRIRSPLLHHMEEEEVEHSKIFLKVSLQISTNKFLFAQASKEFVEFLFSLLVIPLGKVCNLLAGTTSLQNINNIYSSVRDHIDGKYFVTSCTKEKLINPLLPHGYTSQINHFLPHGEASTFNETGCGLLVPHFKLNVEGDLIVENALFFVTDDLSVSTCPEESISILNDLGIPLSDVKEIDLQIGLEEALNILKASLTSTTALTDALVNPMLSKMDDQVTLQNGSTSTKKKQN